MLVKEVIFTKWCQYESDNMYAIQNYAAFEGTSWR